MTLAWKQVNDETPKDRELLFYTLGIIDIGRWHSYDGMLFEGDDEHYQGPGWYVNGCPNRIVPSHYIDIFAVIGKPGKP